MHDLRIKLSRLSAKKLIKEMVNILKEIISFRLCEGFTERVNVIIAHLSPVPT